MSNFSKKVRECREEKGWSQFALAKQMKVHHSLIGKYERGEVKPSIDIVLRLANVLETTVGYLLGETKDKNALRDPNMLKRLNEINALSEYDKERILYTIDGLLQNVKTKQAFAE